MKIFVKTGCVKIKTCRRSTQNQDRLASLGIISIEKKLFGDLKMIK